MKGLLYEFGSDVNYFVKQRSKVSEHPLQPLVYVCQYLRRQIGPVVRPQRVPVPLVEDGFKTALTPPVRPSCTLKTDLILKGKKLGIPRAHSGTRSWSPRHCCTSAGQRPLCTCTWLTASSSPPSPDIQRPTGIAHGLGTRKVTELF